MSENIRMTQTCYIGSAEFPKGSVFEKELIPEGRLKVWQDRSLAVDSDQDVDEVATEKAVMAMAGDDLVKDRNVYKRARAREAQKQRVESINAKAKAAVEKGRKVKARLEEAKKNIDKSEGKKGEKK
jgi:hypothetical protein